MNYRLASTVGAILAASAAQSAYAQQAASGGGLEEVVVTAQRRSENLQDVPISIQALTGDTLSQLNVSTIEEFVRFLPSVTTASIGPGQSNIYMRGLNTGTLGTQGSGTNGPWPNVAVYLDEQSTQVPGRNLDVYAADFERIEVLTGPQGTLFGAGAQAGVLRYITNKPVMNEFQSNVKAGVASTAHGSESYNVEGVVNLPIIDDKLSARLVAYYDKRGGYIDNVYSTFTRQPTDLSFAVLTGGVVPTDSVVINNGAIVKDDINEVEYTGARGSLKWQITDDWDALLAIAYQKIDGEGVFYETPNGSDSGCGVVVGGVLPQNCPQSTQRLKPLEVTVFNNAYTEDEFVNTALTINGKVGALDLVYAGAYLTRDAETVSDYTNYARGLYGAYYQCDGYAGTSVDKCYTPSSVWNDKNDNTNMSHEIRLSSPTDWRMRFVGGVFYEDREVQATTDWLYKSVPECPAGTTPSASDCFYYLDPVNTAKFASATFNNRNRRSPTTGFINDFTREYSQFAAFASVDFDILENLTLTLGTRYYDIENSMRGANVGSFNCKAYGGGVEARCAVPYGQNVNEQPINDLQDDGFKSRANLTWRVNTDVLLYATWSEGYRPGGFNRGTSLVAYDPETLRPQYQRPYAYEGDDLTNIELGWKTTFWDGRAQFNGAIYQVSWKDAQTGFFAPQLGFGNLQFFTNGPDYEVNGIEFDLALAPIDGLTVNLAGSYNKGELTNSPQLINNIPGDPKEGQPITDSCINSACSASVPLVDVFGAEGTELANSPKLQFNIRARYEWAWGDFQPYVGTAVQYQDESYSSANTVNRYLMPSWTTWDASFGVSKDAWNAEFYVVNLTDEDASLYTTASQFIIAEVPIRPRTMGLRVAYSFGGN